jgi:hypothetical protein
MAVQLSVDELRALVADVLAEYTAPAPLPALLTRADLATQLQCCERTVWRLEREGLPHVRLGDTPRYVLADVLAFLAARSAAGEAAE